MEGGDPVVDPIAAVAARMEAVAAPLDAGDGVRRFNELYLAVTREVARAEAEAAVFEDSPARADHDPRPPRRRCIADPPAALVPSCP